MKKLMVILFLALFLVVPFNTFAAKTDSVKENKYTENMYLFYGKECPHCEELMKYLDKFLDNKKYDNVKLYKYEVWHNKENQQKRAKVAELLENNQEGVPFLIVGTNYILGYSEIANEEIENIINFYLNKEYYDPAGDYLLGTDTKDLKNFHYEKSNQNEYNVPLLGKVNAKRVSLVSISIIIGFVDGFNPCAMWILLFLLSILISTKDRKKMWILGLTFILTSGIVYLMFMLSWLKVAKYTTQIIYVRYLVGVFALIFGLVNVYRFIKSIKEKDVGCDVTDATKKRKIMDRIRVTLSKNKLIFAVIGIMLLAISVNLIELLCSLGLPLMYTEILSLNDLTHLQYGIYIFIYILFFLIDDLIIFFIAMKTLKLKGISNKYTKYSHLVGGLIMLAIGLLMIIKPSILLFNF